MFFKLIKRNFYREKKKNPVGANYFLLVKTPFGFIAHWSSTGLSIGRSTYYLSVYLPTNLPT